jgi:group I intron endonuclease
MTETMGIYAIKNVIDGCTYVGSSVRMESRWVSHRSALSCGTHENRRLQRAWIKYGDQSFEFVLLEECAIDEIEARESYWVNIFRALPGSVYNRAGDPDRGSSRRRPPKPKEQRKSIRIELSLYEAIEQIAKEDIFGRSVAGVVREAILRYSHQCYHKGMTREDYARNIPRAYTASREEKKRRPGQA